MTRYSFLDTILWRWAYAAYLDSESWAATALAVKQRDDWTCRRCHQVIQWPETAEAHHLPGAYRRWSWYLLAAILGGQEDLVGIVTLCGTCHSGGKRYVEVDR